MSDLKNKYPPPPPRALEMTYISFCQTVSVAIRANATVVTAALSGTERCGRCRHAAEIACLFQYTVPELTAAKCCTWDHNNSFLFATF